MDEGRNMILLFPTLIDWKSEEERARFAPTCHMFYPRRVVDVPDGKPKWSGISGSSELVEDTSEEDRHKHKKAKQEQEQKENKEHKN
ncbi:uncharacterized protein KY384_004996 [Bacidia gigantensis]|uniref:uncharacterized protein n=1 Tax=Bacidia gigantensis TaxID=2732470 RepID=UPI001D0559A2|nr:uncharacterized protein KY384_004996 [Bacidia gigantensis]KAG8530493.1 hypothetical protein KY384_004996 [Bacidia gigantensis]